MLCCTCGPPITQAKLTYVYVTVQCCCFYFRNYFRVKHTPHCAEQSSELHAFAGLCTAGESVEHSQTAARQTFKTAFGGECAGAVLQPPC